MDIPLSALLGSENAARSSVREAFRAEDTGQPLPVVFPLYVCALSRIQIFLNVAVLSTDRDGERLRTGLTLLRTVVQHLPRWCQPAGPRLDKTAHDAVSSAIAAKAAHAAPAECFVGFLVALSYIVTTIAALGSCTVPLLQLLSMVANETVEALPAALTDSELPTAVGRVTAVLRSHSSLLLDQCPRAGPEPATKPAQRPADTGPASTTASAAPSELDISGALTPLSAYEDLHCLPMAESRQLLFAHYLDMPEDRFRPARRSWIQRLVERWTRGRGIQLEAPDLPLSRDAVSSWVFAFFFQQPTHPLTLSLVAGAARCAARLTGVHTAEELRAAGQMLGGVISQTVAAMIEACRLSSDAETPHPLGIPDSLLLVRDVTPDSDAEGAAAGDLVRLWMAKAVEHLVYMASSVSPDGRAQPHLATLFAEPSSLESFASTAHSVAEALSQSSTMRLGVALDMCEMTHMKRVGLGTAARFVAAVKVLGGAPFPSLGLDQALDSLSCITNQECDFVLPSLEYALGSAVACLAGTRREVPSAEIELFLAAGIIALRASGAAQQAIELCSLRQRYPAESPHISSACAAFPKAVMRVQTMQNS